MKEELEKMTLPDLQEKLAEKEDALKALYKVKSEEITDEQLDEIEEIKGEVTEIKAAIAGKQKRERFAKERVAASLHGGSGSEDLSSEDKELSKMGSKFQFTKAIKNRRTGKQLDGVEMEMYQEAVKEVEEQGQQITGNIAIPSKFIRIGARKDLTIATEGTDVRPLDLRGPIAILEPNPVVSTLGARSMTGLVGDVQFPRETAVPTLAWEGETDANAESTPTMDKVTMAPNRLGGYVDISTTFTRQVSWSAETWIRQKLNRAFERKLDLTAIAGSGSGSEPAGILNLASLNAVDIGANGGAPTYAKILELIKAVDEDDAYEGNLAFLGNPKVRYKLMLTPKQASGAEGNFIMKERDDLLGYRFASSTQVPSNLTDGSGTNLSALIFGNFNSLMIGQWGGIDLLVDQYTQATNGLLRVVINGYMDIAAEHDESFAAIQDMVTT